MATTDLVIGTSGDIMFGMEEDGCAFKAMAYGKLEAETETGSTTEMGFDFNYNINTPINRRYLLPCLRYAHKHRIAYRSRFTAFMTVMTFWPI